MNTLFLSLLSITILYFLLAIFKKTIERFTKIPLCAICGAVALTWIGLLAMYILGYAINVILIAILMGMSVAGSMYKLEKIFSERRLSNFWLVRLAIILFGTVGVFFVLIGEYDYFVFLAIIAILFGALSLFFIREEIGEGNGEEDGRTPEHSGFWKKAAREMKDRMKNCC